MMFDDERWTMRRRLRMTRARNQRKKLAKRNVEHWQFVNDRQIDLPVVLGDSELLRR